MRFVFGLAALAFSAVLAGCGQQSGALAPLKTTPAEAEAHVTKLAGEAFTLKAEGAADLAAVRDALPAAVSLSWSALNFDAASGATVLTDVKLTAKDQPDVGLGIAEVRLWDFNADFAKARLTGQRLTETGKLARRIEAKGMAVFGLDKLVGPSMDAYSNAVTGAVTDAVASSLDPDLAAQIVAESRVQLQKYDISLGKAIIDDVMLRPWSLTPAKLEAGSEFAEVMPMLQTLAAVSRSWAADSVALVDGKIEMEMLQGGQPMSMSMTMASSGTRGIRGGDVDAGYVRDMAFAGSAPNPSAVVPDGAVSAAPATLAVDGKFGFVSVQEMKFDKLYGYLTRGEWPKRTETDLLSYGLLSYEKMSVGINGRSFFSIGKAAVDARKWHWLIPAKAKFDLQDAAYDFNALMALGPAISEPGVDPFEGMPPEMMPMLAKYGLDKPSFDFSLGWDWNPNSGATVVELGNGLDQFIRLGLKYEGGFPNFKAVSDLIPENPEQTDEAALGDLFGKATSLKAIEIDVIDEGGLEKLFGLLADAGKLMPADQGGAMFANQTPQSIRALATAGAYMMADQGEAAMPGVRPLLAPFGAFMDKGGRVKFTAKPKAPMVAATIGERINKGELTPDGFLKELNATTVHTPPPGGN